MLRLFFNNVDKVAKKRENSLVFSHARKIYFNTEFLFSIFSLTLLISLVLKSFLHISQCFVHAVFFIHAGRKRESLELQ